MTKLIDCLQWTAERAVLRFSDVKTIIFITDYRFAKTSFLPIIEMSLLFETTDKRRQAMLALLGGTTLRIFRNYIERPIADTKTC